MGYSYHESCQIVRLLSSSSHATMPHHSKCCFHQRIPEQTSTGSSVRRACGLLHIARFIILVPGTTAQIPHMRYFKESISLQTLGIQVPSQKVIGGTVM